MFIFGKRKRRGSYRSGDGQGRETRLDTAEAELDSLDMKIEEKLHDIREESRDRRFKLPRSARKG